MNIWNSLSPQEQLSLIERPAQQNEQQRQQAVADVIAQVKASGDQAVLDFTARFDGVVLDDMRLPNQLIDNAANELTDEVRQAIEQAYINIKVFHEAQRPEPIDLETMPGIRCEQRYAPLSAVGLYIPGGSAPLPSTVLMLGIPAQVANCPTRILCTPPSKNGTIAAEIRYAAKLCGINQIYLVGGAQAVAAMAYGTQTIPKVQKIFGPGNSYVTEAKQQVSQDSAGAAIDMPAGPSEVLVIADEQANAAFVAADLLSQAEHGVDSQAILVSNSQQLIEQTEQEVAKQLAQLSRASIATQSMKHARYILTNTIEAAIEVSNLYAPEHLIVQTEDARQWLDRIENASSIFVGAWSPESAGDYASGTNHVLPTYGYSRNYSSLGLLDFYRRYTVQELSEAGFKALAPTIMALANAEGLDAHERAVSIRLGDTK